MANGNVKTYLTGNQDELKALAEESTERIKAEFNVGTPLASQQANERFARVEELFNQGQYLEAVQESMMMVLIAWGASEKRVKEIKKEATDFGEDVLNRVKQEVSVQDEDRMIQAAVLDVLADYMWAIADGPFTVDTPLSRMVEDDYITERFVKNIKEALTNS